MPRFEEPTIHRVHTLSANIAECNAETICLTISFHGADQDIAEVEVYFKGPHKAAAMAYAHSINGTHT